MITVLRGRPQTNSIIMLFYVCFLLSFLALSLMPEIPNPGPWVPHSSGWKILESAEQASLPKLFSSQSLLKCPCLNSLQCPVLVVVVLTVMNQITTKTYMATTESYILYVLDTGNLVFVVFLYLYTTIIHATFVGKLLITHNTFVHIWEYTIQICTL